MKKKLAVLGLAALSCAALGLFAACNGGDPSNPPGGETGGEAGGSTTYQIAVTKSDAYTLTATPTSAKAGDTVSVTAAATDPLTYIAGVTYTAGETTEDCTASASGTYTFTMPASDVTLAAVVENYAEDTSDGFAHFDDGVPDTVAQLEGGTESQTTGLNFSITSYAQVDRENVEVTSSDQSVIPDTALSVSFASEGRSGAIEIRNGAIEQGVCFITLHMEATNNSSSATLVKKITVVAEGALEVDTVSVTFTFDLTAVQNVADEFTILFSDLDPTYGSTGLVRKEVIVTQAEAAEAVVVTIENLAVGHLYSVGVSHLGEDGYFDFVRLDLDGVSGSGYEVEDRNTEFNFTADGTKDSIKVDTISAIAN